MNFKNIAYFIAYIPLKTAIIAIRTLPYGAAISLGKLTGTLFFLFCATYRKVAIKNLKLAYNLTDKEARSRAICVFKEMGTTFAEIITLSPLSEKHIEEKVDIEGYSNFLKAQESGKGVFLLSAHLGNWEMLAAIHSILSGSITVIYKKHKNPYVDRIITSLRQSSGIKVIPRRNSARKTIAALKKGETIGILSDLHTSKEAQSVMVPFFGRDASTNYGLALLAIKTGTPIVPAFTVRNGNGRHLCTYQKPVFLKSTGDLDRDIKDGTAKINAIIEEEIRKYPSQWYWVNDRWKSTSFIK
ncbi:MAG: lysophospholipid acyltransferase family protein [bacterium]|nr:lysophospholipid acyltransferase family protein [bacterium]